MKEREREKKKNLRKLVEILRERKKFELINNLRMIGFFFLSIDIN